MSCKAWFWTVGLLLPAGAFAVPVQVGNGGRLILPGGPAAVLQPEQDELWLVTQDKADGAAKEALQQATSAQEVETLDVVGGSGVRLVFPRPRRWQVTVADDKSWRIEPGRAAPGAAGSLLLLNDQIVPPVRMTDVVEAASRASGQRLRVGLSREVRPLPYAYSTERGTLVPTLAGFAMNAPQDMFVEETHLAFVPNPVAVPAIPVVSSALGDEPAAAVTASAAVMAAEEAGSEPPARLDIQIEDVHNPDEAVPFTLPPGYGQAQLSERQRQYARAYGAIAEALHRVDLVAGAEAPPPPPTVVDVKTGETVANTQLAIPREDVFLRKLGLREERNFRLLEGQKLRALEQADTGSDKVAAALDLARTYVAFGRYDQAEGVVRTLPAKEGVPVDMMTRAFLGATLVLQDRGEEALPLLESVEGIEPHRRVWLGAAQVQTKRYDAAANNLKGVMSEVSFYPPRVALKLRLLEGKMLLETLQYQALFEKMDALPVGPDGQMPALGKYYLAQAELELGSIDDGRKLLAEVAESGTDQTAIRAKIDFILDMARSRDLLNPQVILFLEDLRFIWRGDALEATVLRELGRRYIEEKNFRTGLERLKTYAVAFPDEPDMEQITELMREAFVEVFQPENRYLLDNLGLLGMYFDFRELTPPTEEGDRLVEKVADVLDDVLLYDRAADLFERQLEYRVTDPVQQAALGIELAALYRKNEQPFDALAALDRWAKDVQKPAQVDRAYALERARSLLELGRYQEAQGLVTDWLDDTARDVQVDIAWQAEDYATVARLLSQLFDTNEHGGFEDVQTRTDFIRLVYALGQLNAKDALVRLLANYRENLREHVEVADIVNVYAARAKVSEKDLVFTAGRPLQRIAKQLLSLNDFEAGYDKTLATMAERRRQREIYNQKQDYMKYLRENGLL